MDTHYLGLFAAYSTFVAVTLFIVRRRHPPNGHAATIWPATDQVLFARPWLELGLLLAAIIGIILVGQLYQAGYLLPNRAPFSPIAEMANQVLIFSPLLLLLLLRRQSLHTALLPSRRLGPRALSSLTLAALAAFAYSLAVRDFGRIPDAMMAETELGRLPSHAVQVFLEDFAIAMLLVRLAAVLRSEWAAGLGVAALFPALHVPAMLSTGEGLSTANFANLGLDFAIGVVVMVGLLKTRDVLWLFPTHFLMDVAQFG